MKLAVLAVVAVLGLPWAAPFEKSVCPVDKKEFEPGDKTPKSAINGKGVAFCSDGCYKLFAKTPEKYVDPALLGNCPLMTKKKAKIAPDRRFVVNHQLWYVCCKDCAKSFPEAAAKIVGETVDVVSKKAFRATADSPRSERSGQIYLFEAPESKGLFDKEPTKYAVQFGS